MYFGQALNKTKIATLWSKLTPVQMLKIVGYSTVNDIAGLYMCVSHAAKEASAACLEPHFRNVVVTEHDVSSGADTRFIRECDTIV